MLYNQILRPLLLYAVPVGGNCAKTQIHKIQVFQSKVMRTIPNAPWFVRNVAIHKDHKLSTLTECIHKKKKILANNLINHNTTSIPLTVKLFIFLS